MNILFIATSHNPFNPTQGASQRTSLLLQACAAIANVDIISFCTENEPSTDAYNIVYQAIVNTHNSQNRFAKFRCLLTPWKPETVFGLDLVKKDVIDRYVKKKHYDYIVIRYMPDAIQCGLLQYANKLVIDVDDHPVDKVLSFGKLVKSFHNRLYHKMLAKVVKITYNIVISKTKFAFYTNALQASHKNSYHLPNIPYYDSQSYQTDTNIVENRLLFVGDLSYLPNIQGITHFVERVFPLVKKEIQDVTIHIVGRIYDNELISYLNKISGVCVKGFVPSIENEYEECSMVVIPIYTGAGTCIKILEAMQMHRVCVTTLVGLRGYESVFEPEKDILLAHNDNEFAKHIIKALQDKKMKDSIVESALAKQTQYYSRENFFNIVRSVL